MKALKRKEISPFLSVKYTESFQIEGSDGSNKCSKKRERCMSVPFYKEHFSFRFAACAGNKCNRINLRGQSKFGSVIAGKSTNSNTQPEDGGIRIFPFIVDR